MTLDALESQTSERGKLAQEATDLARQAIDITLLFPNLGCELFTQALEKDQATAQAVFRPLQFSMEPAGQICGDILLSVPLARWPSCETHDSVSYFGRQIHIKRLPENGCDPFQVFEVSHGLLGVLQGGKAVGVVDVHPLTRVTRLTSDGREVEQDLVPPETMFQQAFAREFMATEAEIIDFLENYQTFFAQDSEFASRSKLQTMNLSILPLETKFLVYHFFQGASEQSQKTIYQLFLVHKGLAGLIINSTADNPSCLEEVALLGALVSPETLLRFTGDISKWLFMTAPHTPGSLEKLIEGVAQPVSGNETENILGEIFAWSAQVEGFSFEIAAASLPPEQRTLRNRENILDLAHAIQRRTRAIVTALAETSKKHPQLLELRNGKLVHQKELEFIRDGARAQVALLSLLAMEGTEGLSKRLKLSPFLFQNYQESRRNTPGGQALLDSILELWEGVYLAKEKEPGYIDQPPQVIKDYWAARTEHLKQGAETADTPTEIARDKQIIVTETQRGNLPKENLAIIDFGPWDGRRRLKPLLGILDELGISYQRPVGIDISDVPDPIPEMDLYPISFTEAGQRPELKNRFHLAKSDWSAANEEASVTRQMLNFAAFSRCLKENGLLVLDTCFPQGPESYDALLRAYKSLHPTAPEGLFEFDYKEVLESNPKKCFLYYFEILEKFLADAGFEIINLADQAEDYFERVAQGEADLVTNKKDPYRSPIWEAKGKPRITIVAQKRREPEKTDNPLLRRLITSAFGP